jgi:nucleoside-diphosphate-sugar epimerase
MPNRILLAGATGAIGSRLTPLLVDAGYEVFGTTRSQNNAAALEASAVKPIVLDVYDAQAVERALGAVRPEVVIHQLTDLRGMDPSRMHEALTRNARIRIEGTANLIAACSSTGVRRLIAQSIAWIYAPGREPHGEGDALDLQAEGTRATTVKGAAALERLTLHSPPLIGLVLRYGRLYGPRTGKDAPGEAPVVHVDAAAQAALLALERAQSGIFNIVEDNDVASNAKARRELRWDPAFRLARTNA